MRKGLRMKNKMLFLVALLALALCLPTAAFAASSAFDKGASEGSAYQDQVTGNAFLMEQDVRNLQVGCDLYWMGQSLSASDLVIGEGKGGSALLAGQDLSVSAVQIGGSLRAAGQTVEVRNAQVGNNITIAGSSVSVDAQTSANGVYVAASEVSLAGTYKGAAVASGSVSLAGTYEGDVSIAAGTVYVAKGTVVSGTLSVPSDAQLTIEEGASVPNLEYSSAFQGGAQSEPSNPAAMLIAPCLFSCIAHMLLTMLFVFLFGNALRRATQMSKEKPGKVFLSGAAAFIAAPFVAMLLLFPLVTAPISALMLIVMAVVWLFSIPFAGYVLGCRLLPKMRPMGAGVLGTLLLTVVAYLPYMFFVVPTACAIFVAGYLVQRFMEGRSAADNPTLPNGV